MSRGYIESLRNPRWRMPRWLDYLLVAMLLLGVFVAFWCYVMVCELGWYYNRAKAWLRRARKDYQFP